VTTHLEAFVGSFQAFIRVVVADGTNAALKRAKAKQHADLLKVDVS
jgi:hypothetical protein